MTKGDLLTVAPETPLDTGKYLLFIDDCKIVCRYTSPLLVLFLVPGKSSKVVGIQLS